MTNQIMLVEAVALDNGDGVVPYKGQPCPGVFARLVYIGEGGLWSKVLVDTFAALTACYCIQTVSDPLLIATKPQADRATVLVSSPFAPAMISSIKRRYNSLQDFPDRRPNLTIRPLVSNSSARLRSYDAIVEQLPRGAEGDRWFTRRLLLERKLQRRRCDFATAGR